MTHYNLLKRAVKLFPRTKYTDDAAVRHARREWVVAWEYMRGHKISKLLLDHPVERTTKYDDRRTA